MTDYIKVRQIIFLSQAAIFLNVPTITAVTGDTRSYRLIDYDHARATDGDREHEGP